MQLADKAATQAQGTSFIYLAACIASIGGFLWGYDLTVIAGAILFIKKAFALSPLLQEVVISGALFGALLGAAAGGTLAEHLGRRKLIILTAAVCLVGALGSALAADVGWLILFRIIIGAGFGIVAFITPLYIAEIAPEGVRGKLVFLYDLAIMSGVLVSFLADYYFAALHQWRLMLGLGAILAALLGFGIAFLPESPRWLVNKSRSDEASISLRRILGKTDVDAELHGIQNSVLLQTGACSRLLSPAIWPLLFLGIILAILRQGTGISVATLYAPTVFKFAGFASDSVDILATVGVGVVLVLTNLLALYLIDRVGRRPLLLIGLVGMVVSLIIMGVSFSLPQLSWLLGPIAAASLMLFATFWTIGPGTVVFLLVSEIFPLKIRSLAMSLVTVVLWGTYLLVTVTFLTLVNLLGEPLTFWLYALLALGGLIFSCYRVPETKGRSLEEIEGAICGQPDVN